MAQLRSLDLWDHRVMGMPKEFREAQRELASVEFRFCRTCERILPISEFEMRISEQRLRGACRSCRRKETLAWQKRSYWNGSRGVRLAAGRRQKLKREYGLTPEQFEEMLIQQDSKCAICQGQSTGRSTSERLCVDHNHVTGKVRGLLCHTCNNLLGQLKENPELLRAAIRYLEQHA
jgi:hypothetical protein